VLFFSTDCPHCQHTAELLAPLYAELGPKGLEILGCAVNPSAAGNLAQFRDNHHVRFPLGLVTRDTWTSFTGMPATANAYVPHLTLIDREGRIVEDHPGGDRLVLGQAGRKPAASAREADGGPSS
jgi:thiol-disulfide isomerase/thioredoxin